MDKATLKNIKPVSPRPNNLHRLEKVHEETKNRFLLFHPIQSAIVTPTHKLAKFFTPFLIPLSKNEYTVIDSFEFAE